MARTIGVQIVDDSAVVRQVLTAVLSKDPGIRVTNAAADPIFAMQHMNADWPDVVLLDVEMPRMDGITFLKKIMSVRPTPVVICSTLTEKGSEAAIAAMGAGAIAFVTKPKSGVREFLEGDEGHIVAQVKAAALSNMQRLQAVNSALRRRAEPVPGAPMPAQRSYVIGGPAAAAPAAPRPTATPKAAVATAEPRFPQAPSGLHTTTDRLVAIGTSTGGTQALELVLSGLPALSVGMVVVQHMPERFTAAFAQRLDRTCAATVKEAEDNERVLPGQCLIAPGGRHLSLVRDGAHYRVRITDAPPVNRHRPSVDVLFRSVAAAAGRNALGVIMTGMGDDGARGLLAMREAGAQTLGQDEATSVVYGMPAEAKRMGAVETELPLGAIGSAIAKFAGMG